jgi:hypothetical protein
LFRCKLVWCRGVKRHCTYHYELSTYRHIRRHWACFLKITQFFPWIFTPRLPPSPPEGFVLENCLWYEESSMPQSQYKHSLSRSCVPGARWGARHAGKSCETREEAIRVLVAESCETEEEGIRVLPAVSSISPPSWVGGDLAVNPCGQGMTKATGHWCGCVENNPQGGGRKLLSARMRGSREEVCEEGMGGSAAMSRRAGPGTCCQWV